jgi:glycosyltransferase involved in cell wall biosynthesis
VRGLYCLAAVAGVPIVPLVAQDPWFGGGSRTMLTTFTQGVRALGREPLVHYASRARPLSPVRRSLALRRFEVGDGAVAFPALLPELHALSLLAAGVRIAPSLRRLGGAQWAVAAVAPYGLAAARSGRPYACWVATGLEDEWRSRHAGLPRSRRLALRANAPVLLRLERTVLRRAEAVYGISPASARSLAEAGGLAAGGVGVLPIPVALDELRPEPEEAWRATLERPVVVFAGRTADPRKNLPLLVDALRALRARHPGATLRLVGDAGATPPSALPAGATEVLGHVPSLADAFRGASLFVLPSLQEGFGIVAAEALAAGLPVVATPSGGPEDMLRGSGGGVVISGFSAEELAGTLEALLADPERLAAMRSAGRAYVEREHSPKRFRAALGEAMERLEAAHG